jgi:hypothetical protein
MSASVRTEPLITNKGQLFVLSDRRVISIEQAYLGSKITV